MPAAMTMLWIASIYAFAPRSAGRWTTLINETSTDCLQAPTGALSGRSGAAPGEPRWMGGFGKLRRLRSETKRIQKKIDEEFDVVEPEDRA